MAASTSPRWRPSAIGRAVHYVSRHWRPDERGFSTYAAEDRIEAYIGVPAELTRGWLRAHTCVSAVAVQALLVHEIRDGVTAAAIAGLQERQRPDGVWVSYWWPGFAYATYQVLRALVMGEALSDERWLRAREAVLRYQNIDGGWSDASGKPSHAFATAMAMLALLLRVDRACVNSLQRAADFLVRTSVDGLWPAVPILRIPAPTTQEPQGSESWPTDAAATNTVVADVQQVFSTAAAVWALSVTRDILGPCATGSRVAGHDRR